ncbi:MAG: hypothetical protein K5796_01490 [Lachnospiraceae bacterium]|nr:hypothetical protein [Lachnospiraceae bacterium]
MKQKLNDLLDWIRSGHEVFDGSMSVKSVEEDRIREISKEEHEEHEHYAKSRVYDEDSNRALKRREAFYRISALIFTVFLAVVMVLTVSYMPPTGEINKPDNNEVAKRYIEKGLEETGAVNIVAGMILDYRAFDTLGESHVLFVAAIAVMVLLRVDKESTNKNRLGMPDLENDEMYEPKDDTVLQKVALLIIPVIMVFGIYVVLNGHISPGGGFSGGAIIGAALMMFLNAYGFERTEKFFTEKVYKRVTFAALAFYAMAKCYAFFCGANGLNSHISKGIAGHIISAGLILPLDIAVGCVVACTMYSFYALFRKGGF